MYVYFNPTFCLQYHQGQLISWYDFVVLLLLYSLKPVTNAYILWNKIVPKIKEFPLNPTVCGCSCIFISQRGAPTHDRYRNKAKFCVILRVKFWKVTRKYTAAVAKKLNGTYTLVNEKNHMRGRDRAIKILRRNEISYGCGLTASSYITRTENSH